MSALHNDGSTPRSGLFDSISQDIADRGFSIQPNALPPELLQSLLGEVSALSEDWWTQAGIGRAQAKTLNRFMRSDQVCWIQGQSEASGRWLNFAESLKQHLNRTLFLGLFSYESHYARYLPGDFFKKHLDAFKGEANRRVSTVLYLNPGWMPDSGGELAIYADETIKVTPAFGTLVCFLSEDFPHEVLPAARTRFSIAGWYRLNQSTSGRADPDR